MNWIDVKTQLPDVETTVLLCVPIADEPVWLGYLDEDDSGRVWRWVDGGIVDERVTHWMPIPEPPAEGGAA